MQKITEEAMRIGLMIDLAGCEYGLHTRTKTRVGTPKYYHFLAGLARLLDAKRIVEIGTFHGGSAKALSRGAPKAEVVTVDIISRASGAFREFPNITQVIGDSTEPATARRVGGPADLVFIDSLHTYRQTKDNLRLYVGQYVVLDDIRLNDGMARLWSEIPGGVDVSGLVDRPCGFGAFEGGLR